MMVRNMYLLSNMYFCFGVSMSNLREYFSGSTVRVYLGCIPGCHDAESHRPLDDPTGFRHYLGAEFRR